MGKRFNLNCAKCNYGLRVTEGIGMRYAPIFVFYGDNPMFLSLVKDERIRDEAVDRLASGAVNGKYGHELYACPKCDLLENLFYFELKSADGDYIPDYCCSSCNTPLQKAVRKRENEYTKIVGWKCPNCCHDKLYMGGRGGDRIAQWD